MQTQCIIEYKNVQKKYGENLIIPGFSLCIEKHEFVTIIGSSGSGKTTLLKMVNGLIKPDSGDIFVEGKSVTEADKIELRRNIGYAIQGSGLFPHMTVYQNIAYVPNLLNRRDKNKTRNAVNKWLEVVGLDKELLTRYPDELSGGQQQRVGIARSLAASPDILLMDEPFGAVDEITKRMLQGEMKQIHAQTKVTVLFVTHDVDEAMTLGTKMLVVEKGTKAQYDTPENIRLKPETEYVKQIIGNH